MKEKKVRVTVTWRMQTSIRTSYLTCNECMGDKISANALHLWRVNQSHYFHELLTIESQGLWVGWELKILHLASYALSNPLHNIPTIWLFSPCVNPFKVQGNLNFLGQPTLSLNTFLRKFFSHIKLKYVSLYLVLVFTL